MSRGHSGLWPPYRADPSRYPQEWRRLRSISRHATYMVDGICSSPEDIRRLFELLGIGTARRLPQLARRSMLHEWGERRRYSLPNIACCNDLKRWPQPYVVDLKIGRGRKEGDISSAYPSHYRIVPVGTSVRLRAEEPRWLWTWFCLCEVIVRRQLELGPFPWRDSSDKLHWPRDKGRYQAWLWKEQAFDVREAGCKVRPIRGWGWEGVTTDTASWVDWMLDLRKRASGRVEQLVKITANEAIGCQGTGPYFTAHVPVGEGRPALRGRYFADYDEEERLGRGTMIHWQRYCEMQVSRSAYRMALPFAERGELRGIWTDALEVA